ncbi:ACT domain-containing protein ACR12-like isoform X2 [Phalaenopsis equestris]|uniref:ACT domain-containing protein ACR12-like isoform X2 n=1 Tax=Phalaenopsis equestris TaxID=78828 RepID=UPI0009E3458E|nr:ACT domain-containing protein ACR12-like isoform X2 [Phalaenopsis equestris]
MPLTVEFAFRSIASSMVALPQSRVFGIGLPCAQLAPHFGIVKSSLISRGFATSKWGFSENIRGDGYTVPIPIVMIDQDSDPDATIVEISFGDRLGALIDTMKAIKDLGLDVTKGRVTTEAGVLKTIFFITKMGRKIEDPSMLERIRLTIINNLLKYHPESSERLALGEAFGIKAPQEKLDIDVATHIHVQNDGPKRSLLYIETADRPGLLLEIIKMMADINVNVESAEIDTEGLVAKDKFYVSYRGAALGGPLSQVLVNSLRYYLRRPETEEDSY